VDEARLRTLTPTMIGILVRRGADFAAAEDAVQDALVEAVRVWPDDPPRDPKGWLVTAAWRKFLDAARADTSRRHREVRVEGEPVPGPGEMADDTLQLYFLCAHPSASGRSGATARRSRTASEGHSAPTAGRSAADLCLAYTRVSWAEKATTPSEPSRSCRSTTSSVARACLATLGRSAPTRALVGSADLPRHVHAARPRAWRSHGVLHVRSGG
jgi:DNA-directed RNA polymerase specialized sigma24 family protein